MVRGNAESQVHTTESALFEWLNAHCRTSTRRNGHSSELEPDSKKKPLVDPFVRSSVPSTQLYTSRSAFRLRGVGFSPLPSFVTITLFPTLCDRHTRRSEVVAATSVIASILTGQPHPHRDVVVNPQPPSQPLPSQRNHPSGGHHASASILSIRSVAVAKSALNTPRSSLSLAHSSHVDKSAALSYHSAPLSQQARQRTCR